jgi:hypothetical protein
MPLTCVSIAYQNWLTKHVKESTKKRESFFLEFAERIVPGLSRTKCCKYRIGFNIELVVRSLNTDLSLNQMLQAAFVLFKAW